MAQPSVKLLDILDSAGQAELDEVNAEITNLEKKLASLRLVHKVISHKLNGKPKAEKKPRASKPQSANDGRRISIARFLLQGPSRPVTIANQLEIPSGSMTALLDHEWFGRNGNGEVHITSAGRKAVAG